MSYMVIIDNFGPKIIEVDRYVKNPCQFVWGHYLTIEDANIRLKTLLEQKADSGR